MATDHERRATVRYLCGAANPICYVEAPEKEERWPACIRDVSTTGFGLLLARPFAVGVVLEVELEADAPGERMLAMRVVRIAPAGTGQWLVGCVLEQTLKRSDLNELL